MTTDSNDDMLQIDGRRTGRSIDDLVAEVEAVDEHPENQYYYTTYSDVFHTTPRCPHLKDSNRLHVAGKRSDLNGVLVAGANRVAGPTDEFCDLRECGWCEQNGGYHRMEHPDREKSWGESSHE